MSGMKLHGLFIAALLAGGVSVVACQPEKVNRHEDLRAPKVLSVEAKEFNVGWEKTSLEIPLSTNSMWGLEFLAWKQEVQPDESVKMVVGNAAWLSAPVLYGSGDAKVTVNVDANSRSKSTRKGFIKVFTGDENVFKMIPVIQEGNPDYEGPEGLQPLDLFFDFTNNDMGWPTASQSVGEVVYPLDGVNYTFYFGRCNMAAYLVIHNAGAYLGLPAIENYRLTRVTALVSSNNTRVRNASVTADALGVEVVGETQEWPGTGNVEIVYDLVGTEYNTSYNLFCVSGGLPTAAVTLHYEP